MELPNRFHVENIAKKEESGADTESFLLELNERSRKRMSLPMTENAHDIILEIDGGD